METPSINRDRVFNLQLTIQRLEEELTLYRNGTTAEQLFELMKEKEVEIAELKDIILEKDSKLRKLAKSSTEFITKFEDLQMSNRNTLLELAELQMSKEEDLKNHIIITNEISKKYEELQSELVEEKKTCEELRDVVQEKLSCISDLSTKLSAKDCIIGNLEGQLKESGYNIEKLQKRCAELVGEKSSKLRLLDEERQEMITHVQDFRVS